jgi:hypothetical protein
MRIVLVFGIVLSLIVQAAAQEKQQDKATPIFPQARLLTEKPVQEHLKLTPDQTGAVEEYSRKYKEFANNRNNDKEEREKQEKELDKRAKDLITKILKPEQANRLRELTWQDAGGFSLDYPEIEKAIQLTDDQKDKVKQVKSEHSDSFVSLLRKTSSITVNITTGKSDLDDKMELLKKQTSEKLMSLLTKQQLEKWMSMVGEPLKKENRKD